MTAVQCPVFDEDSLLFLDLYHNGYKGGGDNSLWAGRNFSNKCV